jgi:hypothetical protein
MSQFPAYFLFGISILAYGGFWIWAMIHAMRTPKALSEQKLFWAGAMFVNPTAAVWYWYVWKRWAFWTLFSPIFGVFISLPFVTRSLLTRSEATNLTNALFALGTSRLLITFATLLIFPMLLRLAALLHLGRNRDLTAMDRNDWVVTLAIPVYGFGAAVAYCAKYMRKWALVSLLWWVVIAVSLQFITENIAEALIPAGEQLRERLMNSR